MSTSTHILVLNEIRVALEASHSDVFKGLEQCCSILRNRLNHFDWVGFYFADFSTKTLHLKSFSGTPTEHISIPFGKGICGQVAVSNQNFMVPDVQAQDNYIACSLEVRSELVVPLFFEGKNIGQIDIDSHKIDPFSKEDQELLVNCCNLISKTYGSELLRL